MLTIFVRSIDCQARTGKEAFWCKLIFYPRGTVLPHISPSHYFLIYLRSLVCFVRFVAAVVACPWALKIRGGETCFPSFSSWLVLFDVSFVGQQENMYPCHLCRMQTQQFFIFEVLQRDRQLDSAIPSGKAGRRARRLRQPRVISETTFRCHSYKQNTNQQQTK